MDSLSTILCKCLKNDRTSQKVLYEKYYGYALKIAFRYANCYDDATLITNDAFVKAFRSLQQFELNDEENIISFRFKGWLRRIVINTAIDKLRKKNIEGFSQDLTTDCWDISDSSDNADSKLLYKELIDYLKELPPVYQKVFNLFVIDGYSHAEIGEMLQISVGTSKSNLSRAKDLLQKKLANFFELKTI